MFVHEQRYGALADRTGQRGGLPQLAVRVPLECDIAERIPEIAVAHLGDHVYYADTFDGDLSVL